MPDHFHFETEIPVRIGDINYGGHLGNDAVLAIAHEARVRFLRRHNWSEADVAGCGILMSDCAIVYKSEAFHGEVLRIQLAVADIAKVGADLLYLITEDVGGREVARVKTGIVFFDYHTRKVKPVPEAFAAEFAAAKGGDA